MAKKKGTKRVIAKARHGRKPTRHAKPRRRAEERTFPELPDLKDSALMRHAKAFADEMFASEEALEAAKGAKQAIRSRMETLKAHLFVGHGYEFSRALGEERFTARKVKRGAKPADTAPRDTETSLVEIDNGAGEEEETLAHA